MKMMKKIFRRMVTYCCISVIAGILVFVNVQVVNACTKTPYCYADEEKDNTSTCVSVYPKTQGSHVVRLNNGYAETCYITVTWGNHNIYCGGCGVFLKIEDRTCSLKHSSLYCAALNQDYMCK